MKERIQFNKPTIVGTELDYVKTAISDLNLAGNGPFTKKCESFIASIHNNLPYVLLVSSCTHALEISALLLEIETYDEVIIPAFTFVSTANAFALHGAKPVFCDIRDDTLNMNEDLLPELVTNKTKAIVPVHYGGVACNMAKITDIAEKHGVAVVEDNAHGLFGKYQGHYLGSLGTLSTTSFHATKNLNCGEGGALFVNAPDLARRAEIIRDKGTNRSLFLQGAVDKYTWVDLGSSYLLSEISAAFLYAQLLQHELIINQRKERWQYYYTNLMDWASVNQVKLPTVPADCESTYHLFYMILPSDSVCLALKNHLKDNGIDATFHYQPLHLSKMGKIYGGENGDCPVTETIYRKLLRLPLYHNLKDKELEFIISVIISFNL